MKSPRHARLLTLLVLILLAGMLLWRESVRRGSAGRMPSAATPEGAVEAMFEAARRGDVGAYLACFAGPARISFEQAIAETGAAGFARYLRDRHAPVKGLAIAAPERLSEAEVRLRLEYVFADRNEVQTVRLAETGGLWRIVELGAAETVKPRVPYGTPVD